VTAATSVITLNNDVEMPALGFGVFQRSPAETLATGYRMVDTGAAYLNEREVGQAIRDSGVDRGELFVQTKLWISDYGYDSALRAFDVSLRKLGVDYINLYLLHQPMPNEWERTVAAYKAAERLLATGRVRAIGVSNFSSKLLDDLMARTEIVPAVNQVEVHPFFIQRELREVHDRLGIETQAWSALGGVNVYMPKDPAAPKHALEHPVITALAAKYGWRSSRRFSASISRDDRQRHHGSELTLRTARKNKKEKT